MVTNYIKKHGIFFLIKVLILFSISSFSIGTASAADSTTLQTLFANGITSWQAIIKFSSALMYVVGIIIGAMAIMKFKDLSDGKISAVLPVSLTFISAALIASPSIIMTITNTYFNKNLQGNGHENLLTQIPETEIPGVADALNSIIVFVQMLGVIAFFRGLMMLKAVGTGKEGQVGKAMTHIFGGVLAINIQSTVGLLARTFYGNVTLPLGINNW